MCLGLCLGEIRPFNRLLVANGVQPDHLPKRRRGHWRHWRGERVADFLAAPCWLRLVRCVTCLLAPCLFAILSIHPTYKPSPDQHYKEHPRLLERAHLPEDSQQDQASLDAWAAGLSGLGPASGPEIKVEPGELRISNASVEFQPTKRRALVREHSSQFVASNSDRCIHSQNSSATSASCRLRLPPIAHIQLSQCSGFCQPIKLRAHSGAGAGVELRRGRKYEKENLRFW